MSLTAADTQSGVLATYYTIDAGAQQTYTGAFGISAPGSHAVAYWSVDAAGNPETPHTGYVNIDVTVPTVGDDTDAAWHKSSVTVTLTAADQGGSGVAETQYRAQGA